jgi:hypothetical protein
MSKRKRQPEEFDVVEFLRESDDDLKSALNSLLRAPAEEKGDTSGPGISSIPTVNLGDSANITGPANLIGAINLAAITSISSKLEPEINSNPDLKLAGAPPDPRKRRFAVREMRHAQDAHTRAEQHVYECLWENAASYDAVSRTIMIGFGAMARLVGLSESNARINLRSLVAKLAVEEIAEYNCERSMGRTYRIFEPGEILRRRREAGLLWFMRRTLAVVFVDPVTGQPLLQGKPLKRQTGS